MKARQQEQGKGVSCPVERSWYEMNRKQQREVTRRIQAEDLSLEVVHPDAAGPERKGIERLPVR